MPNMNTLLANMVLNTYDQAFPQGSKLELLTDNGTLIGVCDLPLSPWAPAANGLKNIAAPWEGRAVSAGKITLYALRSPSGELSEMGSVGKGDLENPSGAEMDLDRIDVVEGQPISISSFIKAA